MPSIGRILYWLLTGACIGFGVIAILSIGIFFLLAGVILLALGIIRLGGRGLWAALVGFGVLPAAILIWDVVSAPWACITSGGGESQAGVNYYNCTQTPIGALTNYHVMAAGFIVLALAGLAYPLVARLRWQGSRQHAAC
jgi:hypothetical protein